MITYEDKPTLSRVYLNKKRIGTIVQTSKETWCYLPFGSPKNRGEEMPTRQQVKNSL